MKTVCIVCGAEFVEGKGFIEPHIFPCSNKEHGTNWCKTVEEDKEDK